MAAPRTVLQRLWDLGCSLKLAIWVASAATLLIMGGSVVMARNPRLFAGMDAAVMTSWFADAWRTAPQLTWWLPLTALCLLLFFVNTCCCLLDWLLHLKARWRKCGEYLIHTGFLLLLAGYAIGSVAGFRSGPHRLAAGETLTLPDAPAYALRLERFAPSFSQSGPPLDMANDLVLLHEGDEAVRATVRINAPLQHAGLVILATSLDQRMTGVRCALPDVGLVDLYPGSRVTLPTGVSLAVLAVLADARPTADGGALPRGELLGDPALQLRLVRSDGSSWQGWYFLRQTPPAALVEAGAVPQPVEALVGYVSLLTVNYDPGAGLALAGGACLTLGVLLALFSFYRKRARGEHPQI
jgi:cytochrome c biogenesis protein